MEKIVVLGGSFNPPTVGHYLLLKSAVKNVDADKGVFLPASQQYVSQKMTAKGAENEAMPDELRVKMLKVMCDKTPGFEIEKFELNSEKLVSTFESLSYIQGENQDAQIYFISGSDKLKIIPKWRNIDDFLSRFKILVTARNSDDIETLIDKYSFLSKYRDSFMTFDTPEIISEISSSKIRDMYGKGKGEAARQFLFNGTQYMFEEFAEKTYHTINDFHTPGYEFLSNFYNADVTYKGLTYQNSEAAFQAQKVLDDKVKIPFTLASARQAKSLGRMVNLRHDWEFVKVNLML